MLAQLPQQAHRCFLDEIEDVLEAGRAAVVGIGHVLEIRVRGVFEEQPDAFVIPARRALEQRRAVQAVHRNDKIEAFEILVRDHACPQVVKHQPATRCCLDCTRIRRLPNVVVVRSCRVDIQRQIGRLRAMSPTRKIVRVIH